MVEAAWYRARGALRPRWRGTVLLVVLIAIAGGMVLTAVSGARRSSTAYQRFREETSASDMDIAFDGAPGDVDMVAAAEDIRALPEVVALRRTDFPFVVPADSGLYPFLDFLAVADPEGATGSDVDVPRVLDGRLPDADDPDEVAIIDTYADESGLGVGDAVEFESYAWDQLEALFTAGDAGAPAGPRFTFRVTGVVESPSLLSESTGTFVPRVLLTPAFLGANGQAVATYPGGFSVRLERGAADVAKVSDALRTMFPDAFVEITPAAEVDRKVVASIDVIVTALLLTALVAGIAGSVAVAQALARHMATQQADDRCLGALGMTRGERIATHLSTLVPVAAAGAVGALGLAVLASATMPVGVARRAEPDPGLAWDLPVLVVGFVSILVTVLALGALAAAAVTRRSGATSTDRSARPSRAMRALRRTTLSPSATTGVGMALEPRSGTGWAVRSALVGVAFGVTGLVAVVVFIASVGELVRSPARYGSPFDAVISGFSGDVMTDGGRKLLADPDITRAGLGLSGLGRISGEEVPTYAFESLLGDMGPTILAGHAPRGGAEVVLGTDTLAATGADIGDEVLVEGLAGSLRATVVGSAAFPIVDERSAPARGVLLRRDDFERITDPEEVTADIVIEWAEGVDVADANATLAAETETEVSGPRLPSDVNNLKEVESLPRALAALLAALAMLAVVHALVSTVRLRLQDLAVLRALGFERRQLGATLVWQASTIGLIGLLIGVPLGFVAGRLVWRAVAGGIGVVDDPATPGLAVAIIVVVAMTALSTAATIPGRSARRVAPAATLRSV